MSPTSALRLFISLYWAMGILSAVVPLVLPGWPPETLKAWVAEEEARDLPLALLPTLATIAIASIVSSIALLRLRRWGAPVFLVSGLLSYGAIALLGPQVTPGVAYLFEVGAAISAGLVIALCYWSDALRPEPKNA